MVGQRLCLWQSPTKRSRMVSCPETSEAISTTLHHHDQCDLSNAVGDVHSGTISRHYGNGEELHPVGKWNLGSPLQVVASTNSRACQDTSVPLQFFLQRKMAHKASFCIWQQRRSTLENLWHAQWFAEGVLNPRFEHYACWLCRWYGRSPHHWRLSCPQNHNFPGIPTCLHWRQCEVVCHFQWVPAQVSACKPWISNACEEHPRLLSGAMLTHGSLSELTSWGCVGRIAELYPLSPPNATDARCFLPLHRQPCLHELCVPTLNGVLVRRIDLRLSPKVALNCDNRRCLCVFHSTKCLLLFGGRHLENFVPTGTAGISIKTRSI